MGSKLVGARRSSYPLRSNTQVNGTRQENAMEEVPRSGLTVPATMAIFRMIIRRVMAESFIMMAIPTSVTGRTIDQMGQASTPI